MANRHRMWQALTAVGLLCGQAIAEDLQGSALRVLQASCGHCHSANQLQHGNIENILDVEYLRKAGLINVQSPQQSPILVRMRDKTSPMPPADAPSDSVRQPTPEEIDLVEAWLASLSSDIPNQLASEANESEKGSTNAFINEAAVLLSVRQFLQQQPTAQRSQFRFLSFANMEQLSRGDVQQASRLGGPPHVQLRAAATLAVNSLHWSTELIELIEVSRNPTVLAIPLNKLRDRADKPWGSAQWDLIASRYPYALKPQDGEDYREIVGMTDTPIPVIRGDWFLATALRPPLYHDLLGLPEKLVELEQYLDVDVQQNILKRLALRVGFIKSGVSKNANRLAERHESRFGYYWKSYDFFRGRQRGNILQLPAGPAFEGNPFSDVAFEHHGGEVIFSLPNGLQGYFLATASGERLDEAPADLVSDDTRVSGSPLIVNGLSCIACHTRGLYALPADEVLNKTAVAGDVFEFVKALHQPQAATAAEKADRDKFQDAVRRAVVPISSSALKETNLSKYPELIRLVVHQYNNEDLTLNKVAAELSLSPDQLQVRINNDPALQRLGLTPLVHNSSIKRDDWENRAEGSSKYQMVARQLGQGTPLSVSE